MANDNNQKIISIMLLYEIQPAEVFCLTTRDKYYLEFTCTLSRSNLSSSSRYWINYYFRYNISSHFECEVIVL